MEDQVLRTFSKYALVVVGLLIASANTGNAQTQSLVDLLVSQLGVTSEQATGGAGSIFNLAKQQLAPDEFSQIAQAVPGIDTMMSAAPTAAAEGTTGGGVADLSKMATGSGESGSMTGMASKAMGDAASTTGGTGAAMGNLGSLAGTFEQLGMSPDMVQKFVPVVLDYVNSEGGATAMKLLQGALL